MMRFRFFLGRLPPLLAPVRGQVKQSGASTERSARVEHVAPLRRASVLHSVASAVAAFLRSEEITIPPIIRNHDMAAAAAATLLAPALALAEPLGNGLHDGWQDSTLAAELDRA
jgi:hypothetical protein